MHLTNDLAPKEGSIATQCMNAHCALPLGIQLLALIAMLWLKYF